MADEQNGEPSTPEQLDAAQDAALASNDFARYAEVENARDQKTALVEAPPASKENTDKTAAPVTATEKEIQEKKAPKTGEDRKVELAAEIKELLRQRAELQGKTPAVKVADPATAVEPVKKVEPAAAAAAEAAKAAPTAPKLADFETLELWQVAQDKYIVDAIAHGLTESEAKRDAAAAQKVITERSNLRVAAAKEEFADFAEVAFSPTTPITAVVHGFLQASEHEFRLLYKLGENSGAEAKRIAALEPYAQVRALIEIENALPAVGKKAAAVTTPVKKHTAAPPPATNLGAGAGEPADAAEAALNSGDFASYMAKENAREMKAAGRR